MYVHDEHVLPQPPRVCLFCLSSRCCNLTYPPVSLTARAVAHTVAATATSITGYPTTHFLLSRSLSLSLSARACARMCLCLSLPLSICSRACHNAGMGDAASELIDDLQAQSAVRRMVSGSGSGGGRGSGNGNGNGTKDRGGVTNGNNGFPNGDDWE